MAIYGNDALSILVLLTKDRYSSFFEKGFCFHKICFEVKSTDCLIKTYHSLKGYFWKSLVPLSRRIYALSLALKWNLLEKVFSSVKTHHLNLCLKTCWNHSFLLSIWWITFFKHLYPWCWMYMIIECIKRNWLWKRSEAAK